MNVYGFTSDFFLFLQLDSPKMTKMASIIKEFKTGIQENLFLGFAVLWVSLMPSLGTIIATPLILNYQQILGDIPWSSGLMLILTCLVLVILMGLALVPTTMVAVFSGFLFGWKILPFLVISYAIASLLGYGWGLLASSNGLDFLKKRYPKVDKALQSKSQKIPQLIVFIRISPVIPFALSNLLFAFIKVGWKKLLIWGTAGMLPRTFVAFYTGTLANDIYDALRQGDDNYQVLIFIFLLILSSYGIWRIVKPSEQK